MTGEREVVERLQEQGVNESVVYKVDTLNWGGTPTSPDFDVFNESDFDTSLKATMAPGAATVDTDQVILPAISGGTEGETYRVFVSFTSNGNQLEGYFRVEFKR